MIAVTVASGNIGRQLAALLVEGGVAARLLVRNPSGADTHGGALEAVEADLNRGDSLTPDLAGVTRLFLLSPGPDTSARDRTASPQRSGQACGTSFCSRRWASRSEG